MRRSTQRARLPRHLCWLAGVLPRLRSRQRPRARTGAADRATTDGLVSVIQVSGFLDPVAGRLRRALDRRGRARPGAIALVLQLNSPGAVVDRRRARPAGRPHRATSTVPVGVWVGPSGAEASGGAAASSRPPRTVGLAPGSRLEVDGQHIGADDGVPAAARPTSRRAATDREASTEGCSATIGDFVVELAGRARAARSPQGDQTRKVPAGQTRFAQLSLARPADAHGGQPAGRLPAVRHRAWRCSSSSCSPPASASPASSAPGAFLLGCYGLGVLPTRPVGVALLVFAMFGFAIDVQTGVPAGLDGHRHRVVRGRARSRSTTACRCRGSRCSSAIVGMTLAMLGGHAGHGADPVLHADDRPRVDDRRGGRGRIGRVAPEGSSPCAERPGGPARTGPRPIAAGDAVRVVAIDGLVLEVEPLDGCGAATTASRRSSAPIVTWAVCDPLHDV